MYSKYQLVDPAAVPLPFREPDSSQKCSHFLLNFLFETVHFELRLLYPPFREPGPSFLSKLLIFSSGRARRPHSVRPGVQPFEGVTHARLRSGGLEINPLIPSSGPPNFRRHTSYAAISGPEISRRPPLPDGPFFRTTEC